VLGKLPRGSPALGLAFLYSLLKKASKGAVYASPDKDAIL